MLIVVSAISQSSSGILFLYEFTVLSELTTMEINMAIDVEKKKRKNNVSLGN